MAEGQGRLRQLSLLAATSVSAIGAMMLFGWTLDIEAIKSLSPNDTQMKVNTSACFILAGISLALLLPDRQARSRSAGRALAALVAAVGGLTLLEYATGWSLGIDQLLVEDRTPSTGVTDPGRMGANTAFNFVLTGFSLILLDVEWRRVRPAQVGAIAIFTVALVAILGYAYGVSTLSTGFVTEHVAPMALHSATTFVILATGLMLARPDKGMMALASAPGPGGQLVRRLLLPAVVVPPLIGYLRLKGQDAGLYGLGEGLAIFATSLVAMFGGLIWWTGRSLERERRQSEEDRADLEAQLRQSQKMEAIGRLAGGIAHDFNNLLTVVTSYSEILLKETKEGDSRREEAEQISAAAERATALTSQLLAFSRHQIFESRVFDLNEAVSRIAPMLRRMIGEDIELVTHMDPDLGSVEADANQIDQVILNLAVNARDAMPEGGRLTLKTTNVDLDQTYVEQHPAIELQPGSYSLLSVSDTGAGIEKGLQAQIFDPFFTTKGSGEGTGLGLSTVYGILRQSGGAIWVYSEPGLGATFKVYLPHSGTHEEGIWPEGDVEPRAEPAPATETILLVEDEEPVRRLVVRILGGAGYEILAAAEGDAAIALCEAHEGEIDMVITDMVMPGISGLDLAERLLERRPGMRALIMSGYSDLAIDGHGIAFLQKPFSASSLTAKVREVLAGDGVRAG